MSDYEYVPNEDSPTEVPPVASYGYEGTDGAGFIFRDVDTYRIDSDTIGELNRLWAQLALGKEVIASMRDENNTLRTAQIDGSDPRLTDFWARAQELAERANHCEVFDDMAEELGGPRRSREYTVTVSVPMTVWVTMTTAVEASDDDQAEEYAHDNFRQMTLSEGDYDLDDCEPDWSDAQYEVEQA